VPRGTIQTLPCQSKIRGISTLRQAVQDAIEEVRKAQAGGAEAIELVNDLSSAAPDGAFAGRQALRRHSSALARLRAALHEFEAYTAERWEPPADR